MRGLVYAGTNSVGGFPQQWWWILANDFEARPGLSMTAVGARLRMIACGGEEGRRGSRCLLTVSGTRGAVRVGELVLPARVGWGRCEASATAYAWYVGRVPAETAVRARWRWCLGCAVRGREFIVRDAAYGRMVIVRWASGGRRALDCARHDVAQVEAGGVRL